MGKNINELPGGPADLPLTGTELIEVLQEGINKYVEVSEVGGSGGAGQVAILWGGNTASNYTISAQPVARQFLHNNARNIQKLDLTNYTQVRLLVRVMNAGAAGSKLAVEYKSGVFSDTLADYGDIGASAAEVSCSLAATGLIDSGWINLVAGAKADVFLAITQEGGDAAASPAYSTIVVQAR